MNDPAIIDLAGNGADLRRELAALRQEAQGLAGDVGEKACDHLDSLEKQVDRLIEDGQNLPDSALGVSQGVKDALQHAWHDLATDVERAARNIRRERSIKA